MADWIIPVTTLGAAAIAALAGYAGTRTQIRVAEASNAAEHWRERRTTYRLLMDQLVSFEQAMQRANALGEVPAQATPSATAFRPAIWCRSYTHLSNGVRLFAPEVVRDAADSYELERRAIFEEARGLDVQRLSAAYQAHEDAMRSRQDELIRAMRDDLASDAAYHRISRDAGRSRLT